MLDRLLMGPDLPDILRLCTGLHQQRMVNLHPGGTHNIAFPADQLVIHAVHGSGQAVFNRQDAVPAQSAFNGGKHIFKGPAVHDGRRTENLFAGLLGISAFHALAGNRRLFREQLRRFLQAPADQLSQLARFLPFQHLVGPALGHQETEQGPDAVLILFPGFRAHLVQHIPFPGRI